MNVNVTDRQFDRLIDLFEVVDRLEKLKEQPSMRAYKRLHRAATALWLAFEQDKRTEGATK